MATKLELRKSYSRYRNMYRNYKNRGVKFKENTDLMTAEEYIASYYEVDAAIQAFQEDGKDMVHSVYLLNQQVTREARESSAGVILLHENGIDVTKEEFEANSGYWWIVIKTFYPSREDYDMAVSTAYHMALV